MKRGDDPRRNLDGRPPGSRNRSTIALKWLQIVIQDENMFTKVLEHMTLEDAMTMRQIAKALNKDNADTAAYKAVFDSAYGTPKQTVDTTTTIKELIVHFD